MLLQKRRKGRNKLRVSANVSESQSTGESSFRWKAALECAEQGMWEVNLTQNTAFHSDDWFKIRGLDPLEKEACSKERWLARVHPEDLDELLRQISEENNFGNVDVRREYREQNGRGDYEWILSRGRVYTDPVTGHNIAIGTDTIITEIKEAQENLRKLANTEQRWRVAVESARQGLWDINVATGENYFSDEWRIIRGLQSSEPEPPTSSDWFDTVHPADRERLAKEFAARDQTLVDEIRHEYRQRRVDGRWTWIMSRGKVVARDANNKISRMIGTDTDITAIKEAELSIQKLADRFDFAMTTSQVCVWEFDVKRQSFLCHDDMRALLGVDETLAEIDAITWANCIHEEDRSRVVKASQDAVSSKSRYDADYRVVLQNDEVRHIRCRAAYRSDENSGCKLIGASWDVTSDYVLAEELRYAKDLAEERANELERTRAQLEYSANYDALTGLCNRRQLDQRLKQIDSHGCRAGRLAILHVDLDRFKEINDTLGHRAGDKVLIEVAHILRGHMGENALVARTGGDEFVIVIEDAPDDEALSLIAEKLLKQMKQPICFDDHECMYGASIGISSGTIPAFTAVQMLVNADIALYSAKNAGRNQHSFFSTSTQQGLVAHKATADAILRGLDREEFFPVYQLQFDAKTLDIAGVEALVRWQHPEKGMLAPDQFVSVAEEINAISRIDDFVLRRGLADLAHWDKLGLNIPRLSVNVSSRRLSDEKLMQRLSNLQFEKGRVSFELLESIFLDRQSDSISDNLSKLRERGIEIEIDDFGTGHASIACLLNLRPDRFKIDRSLVQPLLVSVEQRRLVSSILEIGRSLGIEVIAEGVETLDHAKALAKMDCRYLQGFGLARPMKAEQLELFVRQRTWLNAA